MGKMKTGEVHPDELNIQTVAEIYKVRMIILQPNGRTLHILPFTDVSQADVILGHIVQSKFTALKPGK